MIARAVHIFAKHDTVAVHLDVWLCMYGAPMCAHLVNQLRLRGRIANIDQSNIVPELIHWFLHIFTYPDRVKSIYTLSKLIRFETMEQKQWENSRHDHVQP
jgi:hypothetical protein